MSKKFELGMISALVLISGTFAHATTGASASCTFGSCNAEVTLSTLNLKCDGNSVYSGSYRATTDFETTTIQATTSDGPRIVAQGVPTSGEQLSATLTLAGKSSPGTCTFSSN